MIPAAWSVNIEMRHMMQMVELASDTFVCIVDESKLVDGLGGSKGASWNCLIPSKCPQALSWLT